MCSFALVGAGTVCQAAGVPTACVAHAQFLSGPVVGSAVPNGTTFTAAASGNPNSRTLGPVDSWTINQDKLMVWSVNGID